MKDRIKNLLDLCIQVQNSQTGYDIAFDYDQIGIYIVVKKKGAFKCFFVNPNMAGGETNFMKAEKYLKGLIE
jgi:hypothetical protein